MARIETIIELIEEVAETLRDTRKTDVNSVRLISKENVEMAIQKLNSVLELAKQDEGYKSVELEKLIQKLKETIEQAKQNSWKERFPQPYQPTKWSEGPMKPWWEQDRITLGPVYAVGMLEGLI